MCWHSLYDAGDHVKFGFPFAASATLLSWGFLEFRQGFTAAGEEDEFLRMLTWFTDYMVKCHVSPNELYVQVRCVARV